jgi:hypothetical protein
MVWWGWGKVAWVMKYEKRYACERWDERQDAEIAKSGKEEKRSSYFHGGFPWRPRRLGVHFDFVSDFVFGF